MRESQDSFSTFDPQTKKKTIWTWYLCPNRKKCQHSLRHNLAPYTAARKVKESFVGKEE